MVIFIQRLTISIFSSITFITIIEILFFFNMIELNLVNIISKDLISNYLVLFIILSSSVNYRYDLCSW